MKIVKPQVSLEWITPTPLQAIERAGRVCYKSEDKITDDSAEIFCRMIYKRGHESVIEHAVASLRIVCDRGVSHEIVRHRIASYSQESTRYCNYSKDKFGNEINVIMPPDIGYCSDPECGSACPRLGPICEQCQLTDIWFMGVEAAESTYKQLTQRGISPQIARSVLPNCLKTELVMTANFREWRHFLTLRTDKAAHPQMREIAFMVKAILAEKCPFVFGDEA